jgi:hypothetical protein
VLRPRGVPDLSGGCLDVENDPSPWSSTVYDDERLTPLPPLPFVLLLLPSVQVCSSRDSASALRSLNESTCFACSLV